MVLIGSISWSVDAEDAEDFGFCIFSAAVCIFSGVELLYKKLYLPLHKSLEIKATA